MELKLRANPLQVNPIPLKEIRSDESLPFNLFIHIAGHYIRYRHKGDALEKDVLDRLAENGVETVYSDDKPVEELASPPAEAAVEEFTTLSATPEVAPAPEEEPSSANDLDALLNGEGAAPPSMGVIDENFGLTKPFEEEEVTNLGAVTTEEEGSTQVHGSVEEEESQRVSGGELQDEDGEKVSGGEEIDDIFSRIASGNAEEEEETRFSDEAERDQLRVVSGKGHKIEHDKGQWVRDSKEKASNTVLVRGSSDDDVIDENEVLDDESTMDGSLVGDDKLPSMAAAKKDKASQVTKTVIQKLLAMEKKRPRDMSVKVALAKAYSEGNRLDEAILVYKGLKRNFQNYAVGWAGLVDAYIAKKWMRKAQDEFDELEKKFPTDPTIARLKDVISSKLAEEDSIKKQQRAEAARQRQAAAGQQEQAFKKIFSK